MPDVVDSFADIDTPVVAVPEERGIPETPDADPMELIPGMVPVFNPLSIPFDLAYNGEVYRLRPRRTMFVPDTVAEIAVGADNQGGRYHHLGLRRLYGPEPRFDAAAKNRGLTTAQLAAKLNEQYRRQADLCVPEAERLLGLEVSELTKALERDRTGRG